MLQQKLIVLHQTDPKPGIEECNTNEKCKKRVKDIQTLHQETNCWQDIGYQFLVGGCGRIYEGRGWGKEGGHTSCYNLKSYGIAFIGNFDDKYPSQCMIDRYEKFIQVRLATNIKYWVTTARPIRSCIEVFRMFWAFSQLAEGRLRSYLLPEPVLTMRATP